MSEAEESDGAKHDSGESEDEPEDAVDCDSSDQESDDDDASDGSDDDDESSATDLDASDEEEEEEEDGSDEDDDDDENPKAKRTKTKRSDEGGKKKSSKSAPKKVKLVVPSVKFFTKHLKHVREFMSTVDDIAKTKSLSIPRAVVDSQAAQEDLYDSAQQLGDAVKKFAVTFAKKHSRDEMLAKAAARLMLESCILPGAEYAPRLETRGAAKPCVISGRPTTMRLVVWLDKMTVFHELRRQAKQSGERPPVWSDEAPPTSTLVPVLPQVAPLLVHMVVVGSARLVYNPLLRAVGADAYARAVVDAMTDLAEHL
jgi:hypothetical protein